MQSKYRSFSIDVKWRDQEFKKLGEINLSVFYEIHETQLNT